MILRQRTQLLIAMLLASLIATGTVSATPTATHWTYATTDVQPFNVWHIGAINYFRLYQTQEEIANNQLTSFPTDIGVTVGVLPFEKLNLEVGFDGLFPGTRLHPALRSIGRSVLFNAKLGTPEGAFFGSWFPALNVGIFNVGTKSEVTDMNIVDFIVGKTLGPFGRIHAGGYYGNPGSALLREGGCKANNSGFASCANVGLPGASGALANSGGMVGYDFGFWKVKDKEGNEYNKWLLVADYASGKNAIGGGGFGAYYFFTKDISILNGPVWFNDHAFNGQWKWTTQVHINF